MIEQQGELGCATSQRSSRRAYQKSGIRREAFRRPKNDCRDQANDSMDRVLLAHNFRIKELSTEAKVVSSKSLRVKRYVLTSHRDAGKISVERKSRQSPHYNHRVGDQAHAYSDYTSSFRSPSRRVTERWVRLRQDRVARGNQSERAAHLVLLDCSVMRETNVLVHVEVEHGSGLAPVLVHDEIICSTQRTGQSAGTRTFSETRWTVQNV